MLCKIKDDFTVAFMQKNNLIFSSLGTNLCLKISHFTIRNYSIIEATLVNFFKGY